MSRRFTNRSIVCRRGVSGARRWPVAFTVIELLVVIIIITLLILVAVPAFRSMMYSSQSALAESLVGAGLKAGHDAALDSTGDADSAVVFFYEPGGRLSMVVCRKVAQFDDPTGPAPTAPSVLRDVFVPVPDIAPIQLPRGWMIRAYVAPNAVSAQWYEAGIGNTARYHPTRRNWVFPETGFYFGNTAPTAGSTGANSGGANRQTFMVRFEAGTGIMSQSRLVPAIVVSPRPSSLGKLATAPWSTPRLRADQADDLGRWVRLVLADPIVQASPPGPSGIPTHLAQLLSSQSSDVVLARPVGQLALYDEERLVAGLGRFGIKIDRDTGSIYTSVPADPKPRVMVGSAGTQADLGLAIASWIEGDTKAPFDGYPDRSTGDAPEARIFVIDRYSGDARTVNVEIEP
ncbi:MAG: hypothetical protein H7Y88_05895 [Phycisphaerales bacterium]|nr:hypothetical protein [Phycisphaerales bacterium]